MSAPVELRPENLRALVHERIGNATLRGNIMRATRTSLDKRLHAIDDYEDWEAMRDAAHGIKRLVLDNLAHYLETFERNATARGTRVVYARDGAEACAIIVDIIHRAGGRVAVKAKSMTSEEIGLGHALAREGIEPIETDLGEYIVQLAGEMPSHITAPALHKSREEIGRLFAEHLGIAYTSDPETLTAVARRVLREKFLHADVGISGVNAAVADTGAIAIVENEGNARMSTTLPRVHIALMGFEKLVPDMRSLTHIVNILARSATGQRISCYTNIIAGPRKADELDGPEELVVVVMDNGRARFLDDARLREALLCIRCGACMNTCPVYQTVGGHGYGSIYAGPIGSVITPVLQGMERAKAMPYASSLCGACSDICPVKIDLHHMLLWQRHRAVEGKLGHWFERLAMRGFLAAMRSPFLYRFAAKAASMFAPLFHKGDGTTRLPLWSRSRDFRMPAEPSFRDQWKERTHERKG
ncbi:MAG: iron-sulfur cluster-binding protein [Ignavibacteria bacterium]|nr:iron-sulfur cluster-binding protein [Ignavibacteria bacterium]